MSTGSNGIEYTLENDSQRSGRSTGAVQTTYSLDSDEEVLAAAKEEEDEELRLAKQMAMAIAANPNLTTAEIRQMAEKNKALLAEERSKASKGAKSPIFRRVGKSVKSIAKKTTGSKTSTSTPSTPSPDRSPKLGDFLESRSSSRDHDDADTFLGSATLATANTASSLRMCGVVWKRRSGLGKYSVSAAWERRRITLRGGKLMYYRTNVDSKDDEASTASGGEDTHTETETSKSWLEHYASTAATAVVPTSKKSARGYLDLVKESASVCASLGHSGAPTPFALSIKVLTQTKWKLCFDSHAELMQWLAAMTDVIVQGSVDSYNAQILQAHDPSTGADGTYTGQLSEPPLIAHAGKKGAGGHRLWVTGHYNVKSDNFPAAELQDISEEDLTDDDEDDEAITTGRGAVTARDGGLVLELDPNSGRHVWSVPAQYIWHVAGLLNAAIVLARASSTTVENFWYLLTFTNIALFGFLSKDKVGSTVKPNVVSRKMARRLSSGIVPVEVEPRSGTNKKGAKEREIPKPSAGFKPIAGTTAMQIAKPTDLPVGKNGHVFAGWCKANPANMAIRSHGYKSTKNKVPSPGEMYECIHVDIFEARTRFPDMASRVVLPKVESQDDGPKTWNAPDTFVISIAIPTDPPKLYSSSENGGGYTVTMYFKMHQETRDILKVVTADGYNPASEKHDDIQKTKVNAVRLFEEWCRRAPTDDNFAARFKVLPNAQNLKEIGLPSWISKYNGKPFLIKRPGQTGFIYRHPDKSCMEFDISLHPFPYLAKQGICFMKDSYFKKVLVTFGFLIEGRSDDELPECLIGLMQLCYPDPLHAIQGEDFLAGKSPKSFEVG